MSYGYTGKILEIDLNNSSKEILRNEENFYRKYLGGLGVASYYALTKIKPKIDPLSSENVLIFSSGILTGTPAPAVPRYSVCAKSPLTNAIGKSEAGGFWGPELKKAGYDALIIKGKAEQPVYITITDDQIEIKNAENLWGKDTLEAQQQLKKIEGASAKVLQIGPGGENQVLYANIVNELAHFNGRNGLGAVMGSKNLKAVVVKGTNEVPCKEKEFATGLTKWVAKNLKNHPQAYGLYLKGTAGGVTAVNANGSLATNNWQESIFEHADLIGSEALEEILIQRKGCFACPIRCKRVVEYRDDKVNIDAALGGPEYETLVLLGSNLGTNDIKLISKANELCNRYTLDTMTMGMTISFAMECYEKGYLTKDDTGGIELAFGNKDILLDLIKMTALKEGFGKELAKGSYRMAQEIGKGTEDFLLHVKKQELPAHDPRARGGMAIQYSMSAHGADHWFAQHDPFYTEENKDGMKSVEQIGIRKPVPVEDYSPEKAKIVYYTHLLTMLYDCLGVCSFGYASRSMIPVKELKDLVKAVTGWDMSMWELMKIGERASVMMREYNRREGFSAQDDKLPKRIFEEISNGPREGSKLEEEMFNETKQAYYQMAGFDQNGFPTQGKLVELDLNKL